MFNDIKAFLQDAAKDAETMFARITDKNTFRRVVEAAFLIARADGTFDADEKKALSKLIQKDLPQFKLTDILEILSKANEKIDFDTTMGVSELLDDIGKAKGEAAELIIRTSCYIGAADGDFDDDEKRVARQICTRMGLTPSDYGL